MGWVGGRGGATQDKSGGGGATLSISPFPRLPLSLFLLHYLRCILAAHLQTTYTSFHSRSPLRPPYPIQMMLVSDMVLAWDEEFRIHLELFAEDEELLSSEFGAAFKKLTELGCSWTKA